MKEIAFGDDPDQRPIVVDNRQAALIGFHRPEFDMSLPDSTIRQKLLGDLKKRSWAHPHSLNVKVTNGTVDLWGFVDSGEERKAIRVAAENIPGVVTVNDHLLIDPILVY